MQPKKKIARIYPEAKIFLTIYGTYYSYDFDGEKAVCQKLMQGQQELLSRIYGFQEQKDEMVRWEPVAIGHFVDMNKILSQSVVERERIC